MTNRWVDIRSDKAPGIGLVMILGVSLPCPGLEASDVYRSTNDQGNMVFSDRPVMQGEQVEVPSLSVVPLPEAHNAIGSEPDAEPERGAQASFDKASFMAYSAFEIRSPRNEQTLPSGFAGNLEVEFSIEPALRERHRVRLLLDGNSQVTRHGEIFELANLERGAHVIQAELLDAEGHVRHRSAPVTFYVQRASVNLPRNPNNPSHRSSSSR